MGVAPLRSTSILPNVTLPLYSPASSSTIGAIARQGPHQAAQKSISTGLSDFNTSESKLASVTSTVAVLAIHPPEFSVHFPVPPKVDRLAPVGRNLYPSTVDWMLRKGGSRRNNREWAAGPERRRIAVLESRLWNCPFGTIV